MMEASPVIYLVAHGETAWTVSRQRNGMTDLPLTEEGENSARALKRRLRGLTFSKVFTSPLQRDRRTCELAGFESAAEIDTDLLDWNYGTYEGRTDADIRSERADWQLFRDGCPHGESPADVTARADRLITRLRSINDDVLLFSSANFIRAIAVRWIGFSLTANARRLVLDISSLSIVGYENGSRRPVIRLWNDTRHSCRLRSA